MMPKTYAPPVGQSVLAVKRSRDEQPTPMADHLIQGNAEARQREKVPLPRHRMAGSSSGGEYVTEHHRKFTRKP